MAKQTASYNGLRCAASLQETPNAPLLYMVHGRAGTVEVMWAFRRSAPAGFSLVTPEAPEADPVGGFSWWQVVPVPAGVKAAVAACDRFLEFCDTFERENNLAPHTRLAIGFSQGAVLLSLAIQARPQFFHGVGLLAGFVLEHPGYPGFHTESSKPEVFMASGTQDQTIPIERAVAGVQLLESWGVEVDYHEDPVGHKVGTAGMRALKAWLASFA